MTWRTRARAPWLQVGTLVGVMVTSALCPPSAGAADRPSTASGQANKAAAESLFLEARKLLKDGNYAEACAKLAASQQLDPGVGTLLNLGGCYEKLGKSASAWVTYREAAAQARASGQSERADRALKAAAALEPSLPRLTISVASKVDGLEILRDGELAPASLWGVAAPVDAGEHVIDARAPGRSPWRGTVRVEGGRAATVTVPELEVSASTTPTSAPEAPVSAASPTLVTAPMTTQERPAVDADPGKRRRLIGIVAAGTGLVALGVGGYFGLRASSKWQEAQDACGSGPACPDGRGPALQRDASNAATGATVAMTVGGIALAAGAVLYFTAPKHASFGTARLYVAPTPNQPTVIFDATF